MVQDSHSTLPVKKYIIFSMNAIYRIVVFDGKNATMAGIILGVSLSVDGSDTRRGLIFTLFW